MRTDKIRLYTTDAEYNEFASHQEGRGEKYRMERSLISKLAMDYGKMYGLLRDLGVKIEHKGEENE